MRLPMGLATFPALPYTGAMSSLNEIVAYCDSRLRVRAIKDFPGARNGLQVENNGQVTRIGASVDAGLVPFQEAARRGVDLLIVHHGMFWSLPIPVTGIHHRKLKTLMDNNLALYSCHLPLDCHPELGNNALLAASLGLTVERWAIEHEGTPLAAVCEPSGDRNALRTKLEAAFPQVTAIECGPVQPRRVVIITGSGGSALRELAGAGADTLVTGELKQSHYNEAQEMGLNVYACGHYATETYGVKALAAELSAKFGIPWEFIPTDCPL